MSDETLAGSPLEDVLHTRLERLARGARVVGVAGVNAIDVVATKWIGANALIVTYRDAHGQTGQAVMRRDDEPRIRLESAARAHDGAAPLMRAVGERLDLDTVKELAYYLYSVCERKGWTSTALLYNGLGTCWLDLDAAARKTITPALAESQAGLDLGGRA